MPAQVFVPFVTYPGANDPSVAAKVATVAADFHAEIHACAFNADIPDVSNAWSNLLLDVPEMIRKTEEESRRRGEHLLRSIVDQAEARKVTVTTERRKGGIALL